MGECLGGVRSLLELHVNHLGGNLVFKQIRHCNGSTSFISYTIHIPVRMRYLGTQRHLAKPTQICVPHATNRIKKNKLDHQVTRTQSSHSKTKDVRHESANAALDVHRSRYQ